MKRGKRNRIYLAMILAVMATVCSSNQIVIAGRYEIVLDVNGDIVSGSGTGFNSGTWYPYTQGRYIQWFPNGLYAPERIGYLYLQASITTPNEGAGTISYDIGYCWSKPAWDISNPGIPPLPESVIDPVDEFNFISKQSMHKNNNIFISSSNPDEVPSIEPRHEEYIKEYNPAWVGVIVKGSNIKAQRSIIFDCLADMDEEPNGDDDVIIPGATGACCNLQTGSCFITTQASCIAPYSWLGQNTTCAACDPDINTWDFGDAPISYSVLKAEDGARHFIEENMFLGQGIDAEPDGQPSIAANLDQKDDGVKFNTALHVGASSEIEILATQPGYINAWLDFNHNGIWADLGEQIFIDQQIEFGTNKLTIDVPIDAVVGQTYARFRYSSHTGVGIKGQALDGEVEDYLVTINNSGSPPLPPPSVLFPPQSPEDVYVPRWTQAGEYANKELGTLNGWPETSLYLSRPIIADDWTIDKADPITGLRWWGSFFGWTESVPPEDLPDAFHIAVWSDPEGAGVPSAVIWDIEVDTWSWSFSGFTDDPRDLVENQAVFEFGILLSQDQWFYPTPNISNRYWISIAAIYNQTQGPNFWGWLTRPRHQGSAAVRIYDGANSMSGLAGQWPPVEGVLALDPQPIESYQNTTWDVSFQIITKTNMGSTRVGFVTADVDGDGLVTVKDLEMLTALWMAAVR